MRIQRRYPERVNPADRLTDAVFKSHFRLDKLSALRLVDLLGLHQLESNRGLPLHPMQSLCICLSHFAGGQFQRVSALCGGEVSKSSAQRCITKVRDRILELKNEYIKIPTREEREETAAFMLEKYHLPGFAYGIDGMVVKFEELARDTASSRLSCGAVFLDAQGLSRSSGPDFGQSPASHPRNRPGIYLPVCWIRIRMDAEIMP